MIELTKEQNKMMNGVLAWLDDYHAGKTNKKYTTLAGLAGTGKTTVLGFMADELRRTRPSINIAFVTYTGKASVVLKSKLQNVRERDYVGTIHSLIYFPQVDEKTGKVDGWFLREPDDVDVDLIIIDEASMVGKEIFQDLLDYHIPIIGIGDHGQLPPVGSQNFNLMQTPEFCLTEIHRQALDNPIIKLSMIAREEGWIDYGIYGKAVAKLHWSDPRCAKVIQAYNKDSDLIALCGMNATRVRINQMVRKNHGFTGKPKTGERAICLKNDKNMGIMNGQIGNIVSVINLGDDFYELRMSMDGQKWDVWPFALRSAFGMSASNEAYAESNTFDCRQKLGDAIQAKVQKTTKDYYMGADERRKLKVNLFEFGYCVSVHKSQGSEWGRVILFDERNRHQTDDDYARWLYTGITRAKEKLIIIEDY